MSLLTAFFNLIKPAKTDGVKVSDFNSNMDIIDSEMHRPPLSVNGVFPDSTTRDLELEEVPLAGNLSSDEAQSSFGTFIERSSGGAASIADGSAWLVSMKGNSVKTGYIAESLTMTVTPAEREEGVDPITATIDRDTFVAYVSTSGTTTLTYTTAWSADPTDYGITVTGTPISGDEITVVYVKENRGTITSATPTAFNSTGWNLYNNTTGYAKVVKYSDSYGFVIGGTYSLLEFATTVTGTRSAIVPVDGYFSVPSDGYVFVTGGNATDTEIYMTWSDWIDDTDHPSFEAYTVDEIDISEAMVTFPYGLMSVGVVRDEINLNTQKGISSIQRLAYTSENLAAVIASGVDYDTDENYIYAVRETAVTFDVEISGEYTVSDHGIEYFSGTSIPVVTETLYGNDLKGKLRRDVLTISAQELTASQKTQVLTNIGAASTASVTALSDQMVQLYDGGSISKSSSKTLALEPGDSYLVITTGGTANRMSAVIVFRTSTAAIYQSIVNGSDVTYSSSSSGLTIANGNTSYSINYFVIKLNH